MKRWPEARNNAGNPGKQRTDAGRTRVEGGGLGAGGEEEGDGDDEAADDDRQQTEPLRLEPHAAEALMLQLLHAAQTSSSSPGGSDRASLARSAVLCKSCQNCLFSLGVDAASLSMAEPRRARLVWASGSPVRGRKTARRSWPVILSWRAAVPALLCPVEQDERTDTAVSFRKQDKLGK